MINHENMVSITAGRSIIKTIKGSPFSNNGITFAILQRFGNSLVVKERITKYDTGKDKTSAQFFSISVGKLLGLADLLLEKDLMILIISSGVVGWKKKDFKTLPFRYVIR